MSTPDISRPVERYGKDTSPKKPTSAAGKFVAIVMVLMVAAIAILAMRHLMTRDESPVSASFITHERLDDDTSRVWVDIVRSDVDEPSYCIVTALNYAMAEVGRREVAIPAGGDAQMRISVDMPVRDYPVSGTAYGCSSNVPFYLDMDNPEYNIARTS